MLEKSLRVAVHRNLITSAGIFSGGIRMNSRRVAILVVVLVVVALMIIIIPTTVVLTSREKSSIENSGATKREAKEVYEFNWELTWETSMIYTDPDDLRWNVTLHDNGDLTYNPNGTDITIADSSDVVTLDGYQTKYIAVNGQLPGPTIRVPLGAEVYVHVTNSLLTDSATIHWHGLTQRGTQWSDGAPYISQCPILPGTSFTYRFMVHEAGTFWYHSHLSAQRMDGLFGALIVYDPSRPSYTEFTVQVNDWLHVDSNQYFSSVGLGPGADTALYDPIPDRYDDLSEEDVGDLESDSFLINGRGRFGNNNAPLTVHRVQSGEDYLFRFINVGFDNMFEVSIDGHKMTVVGTDSCEVEPVQVNSVFLAIGERVNVLIKMDQTPGNYWIRYRAPHKNQTPLGKSILTYTNSTAEPMSVAKTCSNDTDPCVALNCPFETAPGWSCIPIHHLRSTEYHEEEISKIRGSNNISEHFFAYSFMVGDSINGKTLELPASPFYQEHYSISGVSCDPNCLTDGCGCTHVQTLPSKSVVQIVVMHHVLKHFIHTWHQHGYRFAVLKVVYGPKDPNSGLIMTTLNRDIRCSNDLCHDAQWTNSSLGDFSVDRPPLKDTVLMPVGGYVVVRIYTDNPGYWMAHCHQTEHLHEGMALVFEIDGEGIKDNIPDHFPRCGNYVVKPL